MCRNTDALQINKTGRLHVCLGIQRGRNQSQYSDTYVTSAVLLPFRVAQKTGMMISNYMVLRC